MKTFYKKMNFLKLLRLPALIFFILALSYSSVNAQSFTPPNPVCYGTCVQLLSCTFPRALQYCDSVGATFRWAYIWGNNLHDMYDGHINTNEYHPGGDPAPHGSTWKNPIICPGDSVYTWISDRFVNFGDFIYLSIQIPGHFSGGSVNLAITNPIFVTGTVTNIQCGGLNTGAITTTVTGGSSIYSGFLWSSGQTSQNISNIGAGTYTILVTDNNSCTATASFTVTAPPSFNVSSTVVGVSCFGGNNGSICLTPTGGSSPYTYAWSNGAGNVNCATNLVAGTYTATVTDANGCPSVKSNTVSTPASINIASAIVNVSCNGGNNGSINITASGGSPGFTYKWSNGPTTTGISNLTAGTYTVTVTDTKSCTTTSALVVTQPPVLSVTPTVTNVQCNGQQSGSINITVTGGTPSYTFLWSNGFTGEDLLNRGAGTYTVTVTDSKSCTAVSGGTISQPPALLITNIAVTNVKCTGDQTGVINITVTGGTPALLYKWSNSATTQNLGSIFAGTYTVTVTDANGCSTTGQGTVTQPTNLPQFQATITNVACFGVCTGAIAMTPSGGTPGYTYLWGTSPVQTTQNISNLCAGNYNLTVTDANGCKAIGNNTVTQPSAALTAVPTVTNILCNGQLSGSINITVNGGTPAYAFLWSNGFTGEDLLNRGAGTYTVTVTDAHLCTTVTGGTITQPPALLITNLAVTNVKCTGDQTGAINITVTGGTPVISFKWSNSATTQNLGPVFAGTYTVTVTDANGCSTTGQGTITQPTNLPQFQATITNVACFGVCTGAIAVTPSGGTPGYTYLWGTSPVQTTQNISNLCAGNYNLTVTDANGCKAIGNNTVTQPAAALTAVPTVTNILCNGQQSGSVTLVVSGGTTAYSYLWNNGFTGKDLLNRSAGTYTVTVTDAHLCTTVSGGTISQPPALLITNLVVTNVKCTGDQTGAINITVTGGTPPIGFLWSNSATTQNLGPVFAGTYTVTVTDANGCTTTGQGTITQPTNLPQFQATITNVACFNVCTGAIAVTPSGGTPGYTYIWGTSPVQTTQNISNLCAGNYNLTVTDANGCKAIGNNTVTQPAAALTAVPTVTNILCNGQQTGSITLVVTGGTTAYSYLWNNGFTGKDLLNRSAGTYTVTVTDAHACTTFTGGTISQPPALLITNLVVTNVKCTGDQTGAINITVTGGTPVITYKWSNSATTQNLGPVFAGTYTVTVTDANGCSTIGQGTITQPTNLPQFQATITNVACFNVCTGAITVTPSGGTPGYTYIWGTSPVQTTQNISNLCAGNYNLTVTDANGCKAIGNNTVTQPAAPLVAVPTVTHILCNGAQTGSITLTVTGGTTTYSYLWNTGATTRDILNKGAGTYTVTVTDAHLCTTISGGTITQPPLLQITNKVISNVKCTGDQTGAINITVTGGTPPISFLWSNAATTQNLVNVFAGTYTVTVTDFNGCNTTTSGTITQPLTLPQFQAVITNVTCNGLCNGAINVTPSGGTPGYTYIWGTSPIQTTQNISGLCAGNYNLTVTDANGCKAIGNNVVTQPALPLNVTVTVPCNVFGGQGGSIQTSVTGGTTAYSYLWNTGATSPNLVGLSPGTYTVTVTDSHNCKTSTTGVVLQPLAVNLTGHNISCYGYTDGFITTTVTGGTTAYTYLWSNGKTTPNINNLGAGTYTVTVTDSKGCVTSGSTSISGPPEWHPCLPCPLPDRCQGDTVRYCVCRTGFFWPPEQGTFYPSSFEWSVTGGTIIQGCCDTCITVVWNHCDSGTICVTEIRHDPPFNGCRQTKCCTVHLNPVPTPLITGPLTVWADSTTMYTTTASSCYLYSWSVTGGVIVAGQGTNTIWVHWTACGTCDLGQVKVCVTDACKATMCCGCTTIDITITPQPTANLQGYVTYANPYNTPLNGVVIQLINSMGQVIGTCTSGPNFSNGSGAPGYYSFSNVPAGTYTMHVTFNGAWGGNNATDALLIELHTAHTITLTGLPLLAGDVTADMVVNATDALWVKLRTVAMINYYPAGDWVFNNGSIIIPPSGIVNYPIGALCTGDVNASYIPQGMKDAPTLMAIEDGIQNVTVNEPFNYTIRTNKAAELGAITLFLGFDNSRFDVLNVSTPVDGLKYKVNDNSVAVAWSNTSTINVNGNDPILTFQMKAKEAVSAPSQVFTINSGSEVADASAAVLNNFDVKMSSVVTPGDGKEFSIFNFPNPFQNTTEIVYTIPEQAHVKLVVTNMFGTVLTTLVDADQAAGTYQLKVDPADIKLSSGVYLYKIVVDGASASYNKTNKMLFTR